MWARDLYGNASGMLPEPQDSRSQDRCNIDESLLVGSARSFSAVGHVKISAREWPPIAAMAGAGSWPSAASIVYLPGGDPSWRRV